VWGSRAGQDVAWYNACNLRCNLPGSVVDGVWKVERHASTARPTYLTPNT
jgi:hypothetical protein